MEYKEAMKSGDYSHITGSSEGYVYVEGMRELMASGKGLLRSRKGAFLAVLGSSSAGKSAFIAELLKNESNPPIKISAAELGAFGMQKLVKLLRRAVRVTFNEQHKLVEGEVLDITQTKLTLKTVDIKSVFEIGVRIRQELDRERVEVGDVIRIYKDAGFVTRLGRSSSQKGDNGDGLVQVVDTPEGECFKVETVQTTLSLDELDTINFAEEGEELLFTETYVTENIRAEVDRKVYTWIKEGKADCDKGVVIVEGADYLPDSAFDLLQCCKHDEYFPLIILSGLAVTERIKQYSFVISLPDPSSEYVSKVLCSRAEYLGVSLDAPALEHLIKLTTTAGLAAAMQIMHVSIRSGVVSLAVVEGMLEVFEYQCS